jgi:F0F1-type ATP synthase epsilon subunit
MNTIHVDVVSAEESIFSGEARFVALPGESADLDAGKAEKAKLEAEEALKNAKSEVDLARAQSELAVMAAQIAALRKFRQKR